MIYACVPYNGTQIFCLQRVVNRDGKTPDLGKCQRLPDKRACNPNLLSRMCSQHLGKCQRLPDTRACNPNLLSTMCGQQRWQNTRAHQTEDQDNQIFPKDIPTYFSSLALEVVAQTKCGPFLAKTCCSIPFASIFRFLQPLMPSKGFDV